MKKAPKKPLHYLESPIHRIVKGWIAQTGDITRFDGSGGESIYGGKFNDEKEGLKRSFQKGSVAMANSGKNSNTSQFFICLSNDTEKMAKMLNGKYVVFGKVVEEYNSKGEKVANSVVLDAIDIFGSDSGEPIRKLFISKCDVMK